MKVFDRETGKFVTTLMVGNLSVLFRQLAAKGIRYSVSGKHLFIEDLNPLLQIVRDLRQRSM